MPIAVTPRLTCNKCMVVAYAETQFIKGPIEDPSVFLKGTAVEGWVYGDGYTLCPSCK